MKKKHKIYFFHPYSGKGGADLSISRLINGLDHNKFEIDFLSLNKPKIKNRINHKINYKVFKQKRTLYSIKHINEYISKEYVNKFHPEVKI